jgi:hypothetical protein
MKVVVVVWCRWGATSPPARICTREGEEEEKVVVVVVVRKVVVVVVGLRHLRLSFVRGWWWW